MGIIGSLRKKDARKPQHAEDTDPTCTAELTPSLMLMLPDASGIAAYQLNQFPSTKAAEFFIDSSLRGHPPEGSVMFWALTWQPAADAATEPLVLIREDNSDVVYPFSFADINSSFEFVQHEMHRGLHLSQVMIYWAVPAHVDVDFWGRSMILPSEPPLRLNAVAPSGAENEMATGKRTAGPAEAYEPAVEVARYLADADIAETVRQAEQAVSTEPQPDAPQSQGRVVPMPVPGPSSRKSKRQKTVNAEPIDFPSASKKAQQARHARAAVTGWANFALAVDEALDVYVSRQVATKLTWNRLMRALGQAIETEQAVERKTQEKGEATRSEAAHSEEAGRAEEARQEAIRTEEARLEANRREAARLEAIRIEEEREETARIERIRQDALRLKAEAARLMRKAWLNAAWTLEEASYAHALEQRSRSIRAWRFAMLTIAEAVEARMNYEKILQLAWSNAGQAIGEAHRAYFSRLRMFEAAWRAGTAQIKAAVILRRRLICVRIGLNNFSIAVEEAVEARAYQQEMTSAWNVIIEALLAAASVKEYCDRAIAAWNNVAFALEGVCHANVKKQKRTIRAWSRLAKAMKLALKTKLEHDAAIEAWTRISIALAEASYAQSVHNSLVAAWASASTIIAEVVAARMAYEAAVAAWTNAGLALEEAVIASARHHYFLEAWKAAGFAISHAVESFFAWRAGLAEAWELLSIAVEDAAQAMITRQVVIVAWDNAMQATGEMVHAFVVRRALIRFWRNASQAMAEAVSVYMFKRRSIAGWTAASIAFKQALVAEAKLRVTQAHLNRSQMAEVEKAVKSTASRGKTSKTAKGAKARNNGHSKNGAAAESGSDVETFAPELMAGETKLPEESHPKETSPRELEVAEALLAAVDAHDLEAEEPTEGDETSEDDAHSPLFPSLWRSHDPSRWKHREEPFNGFESRQGRF